jgi:hypothetical protein
MRNVLCLLGLLSLMVGPASGITIEVVRLYQPLSLHGTDAAGDNETLEEVVQASVMSRPLAVAGAIPEDLVMAVSEPCKIMSNSPAYTLDEANLLILCKIGLTVDMNEKRLVVRIDVSKLAIPEAIDLSSRQILRLSITAIRKTLEHYYAQIDEELEWELVIAGTKDKNASLKDLGRKYKIGG